MRLAAAALVVALLSWPVAAVEPARTTDAVIQGAIDGVIRPAMITFSRETSELASAMTGLCANPSATALEITLQQYAEAVVAYGRVEPIHVGPLSIEGRAKRVLYWPDPEGVAGEQVEALIVARDPAAADPAALAGLSAAVQGLGALEVILFSPESTTLESGEGNFRCTVGLAMARGLTKLAQDLAAVWYSPDDISLGLLEPGPDRTDFRTRKEALAAVVGVLVNGLQVVREERLRMLIDDTDKGRADSAVLFRSGLTMAIVESNLRVLHDLLNVSGMGLQGEGTDPDLVARIDREFGDLERAMAAITLPVAEALADPQQRGALSEVIQRTDILQVMIGEQLAAALGLTE